MKHKTNHIERYLQVNPHSSVWTSKHPSFRSLTMQNSHLDLFSEMERGNEVKRHYNELLFVE